MCQDDGSEPVEDAEILYRRVPACYMSESDPRPSPQAFHPQQRDTAGLSMFRAKYRNAADVARGASKQPYYVAVVKASDLRRHGMTIVPRVETGGPGHVEIPELNYADRHSDRSLELKVLLVEKLSTIEGPFTAHLHGSKS